MSYLAKVIRKFVPVPNMNPLTPLKDLRWPKNMILLKGLSHEIDFKNVGENWQILALTRAAAGYWIFLRHLWFLVEIKPLLSGKC
jgi:hypothetical protein